MGQGEDRLGFHPTVAMTSTSMREGRHHDRMDRVSMVMPSRRTACGLACRRTRRSKTQRRLEDEVAAEGSMPSRPCSVSWLSGRATITVRG
jgi:hypothetical protein